MIVIPKREMKNFEDYVNYYPIEVKGKTAIMYKAVKKVGEEYISSYSNSFKYIIGDIHKEKCAPASEGSCSSGLHVSFKSWAVSFGSGWNDMALLECEVDIKNIIVSEDSDGKVRTSALKVIREVPESEWYS